MHTTDLDSTVSVLLDGYAWLPDRRRRADGRLVRTRLLGQRAVGFGGPDATRFFYDEKHVQRHTALPEPVISTLFGNGAVHTLDGDDHRVRKAMFMSLATRDGVAGLAGHVAAEWDRAVPRWIAQPSVVLFDEASRVLTAAVCRWAGVPLRADEVAPLAADLVAMVDGFATPGVRHVRARLARARREAWLAHLVSDVRIGTVTVPTGSAVDVVAHHRDRDGDPLSPTVAAVELLNVLRPTVAVCWFVAFAGHALHRWPEHREPLRAGDEQFAETFTHELRRFYPFAPFLGGRAVQDLEWAGEPIPAGTMVLLDVFGHDHDPALWSDPYRFAPARFLTRSVDAFDMIPQGGGDPNTGHRCPGESYTVALVRTLAIRLAQLEYDVPEQDLTISLRRIPARPRSGFVLRMSGSGQPAVAGSYS